MMAKLIHVFDLDDTVLDSSHRRLVTDDHEAFIRDWKTHTARQILKDKPLPLARFMRMLISQGESVWILTAREMGLADYRLLENHGIRARTILSREAHDNRPDSVFKVAKIRPLLNLKGVRDCKIMFYDDKESNREALANIPNSNIKGFNPEMFNGKSQPQFTPPDLIA